MIVFTFEWSWSEMMMEMHDEPNEATIKAAIGAVLEENLGLVALLGDNMNTWTKTLPQIWRLVFKKVFGQSAKNPTGTPSHYEDGVADPRWKTLLHEKGGMRHMAQHLHAEYHKRL